jgi:protein TonB
MASSRFILGVVLSSSFHVLAYVQMHHGKAKTKRVSSLVLIEMEPVPPPPKEAPPPPMPVNHTRAEQAPLVPAKSTKAAARPEAPLPAARAGKVLSAPTAAPAVADFTVVEGASATFAGGITSQVGTASTAVSVQPRGVPGIGAATSAGRGAGVPAGPDRSKAARPVGSDWDCSKLFPSGASVDSATAIIIARVRVDGFAEAVSVVSDPGQGFGAAARACALQQRYAPAEDHEGRPVVATTLPFRVRFTR